MRRAAVAVIAVILIGGGLGVGYLAEKQGQQTTTSTSVLSKSEYDSSLGIELTMSIGKGTISEGDGIPMHLSLENTLDKQNNLSLPGGMKNPPELDPCSTLPFGVVIFQGNYNVGNVSKGKSLGLLWGPNTPVNCPSHPYAFTMPPMSNEIVFQRGSALTAAANATYWGYWTYDGGDVFRPFSPGFYTIEGEDWWGQVELLHFEVVLNQSPLDCATIASNSSYLAHANGTSTHGPLKLDAYYLNPQMNDTVVFALSNTGNSTLTSNDTASVGYGFTPYTFNPDDTQNQTWRYYAPNGTMGFPAIFYPDQCVLIDVTLSSPFPQFSQFPLALYFAGGKTLPFLFSP